MSADPRIVEYRDAALAMIGGRFDVELALAGNDEVAELGRALTKLGTTLEGKAEALRQLMRVTAKINSGLILDEILDHLYLSFRDVIPYDRIGFSLLSDDRRSVMAYWARSEAREVYLSKGYSVELATSSLREVMKTARPRIINDLEEYLASHPGSESTRLVYNEGMRSSLTCPLIAMGQPVGFMFFSSMKPGTYRDVHVDVFLQIAGLLSTIVEKGRMYQKLLELDALKNQFLGIAAHDLRNPLAAIKGFSDILISGSLARKDFSAEQLEALYHIRDSSQGMLSMVNDLLDVSAIEAGRLGITWEEVALESFLGSYYASALLMASQKSIDVVLHLPKSLPAIRGDRKRLNQVMDNLVSNAVKFSYSDSVVTIEAKELGEEVEISVTDQGQGIPEKELPMLFTDFGRTSVLPTQGEPSTGLGLAIVKRIVDAHGGRIFVESELGKGTSFRVRLPIRGADTDEARRL